MEHTHEHSHAGEFPTSTEGLPEAVATRTIELEDGDAVDLRIGPVAKRIGDATVRMLAYNGSIPGPTLRVREGSELVEHDERDGIKASGPLEDQKEGDRDDSQPPGDRDA